MPWAFMAWSREQVALWANSEELDLTPKDARQFEQLHLRGKRLPEVSEMELREEGISLGGAKDIMAGIRSLMSESSINTSQNLL